MCYYCRRLAYFATVCDFSERQAIHNFLIQDGMGKWITIEKNFNLRNF